MKTKIFGCLLAGALLALAAGCVKTVDGHTKGAVPFSKDKIYSRYERTVPQIVAAARVVLARNGQIQADDSASNSFRAKVNQSTVWVKISKVDEKVSEVVTQARTKGGLGHVDLASEISKQIAIQLAVGQ